MALAERTLTVMQRGTRFDDAFAEVFHVHHPRVFRYIHRLSGDAELAGDVAQDTFVRLYERGALPEHPEAWLITVAMNLFRNARSTVARRRRLLTLTRAEGAHGDPPPNPDRSSEVADTQRRVRHALDAMPERSRALLLLHAEGYSYRDMANALELNEASVGTLLARAKRAFRDAWEVAQ